MSTSSACLSVLSRGAARVETWEHQLGRRTVHLYALGLKLQAISPHDHRLHGKSLPPGPMRALLVGLGYEKTRSSCTPRKS